MVLQLPLHRFPAVIRYLHVYEVLFLLTSYRHCHKKRNILGAQIDSISTRSMEIKTHLFSTICKDWLHKN